MDTLLLKILDIINYEGDRNAFIKGFTRVVYAKAVADLLESLPEEKQEEVKKKSEEGKDNPEMLQQLLEEYFTKEQVQEAFKSSAQENIVEYLKSIESLTDEQAEQINSVASEFEKQQQASHQPDSQ